MGIQIYFINDTKKQVVDTKKLYGDFEDKQQLLCYLNLCQGDTIRIEFENSTWVEEWHDNTKYKEYKYIPLYDFQIYMDDDLHTSSEFERLMATVKIV